MSAPSTHPPSAPLGGLLALLPVGKKRRLIGGMVLVAAGACYYQHAKAQARARRRRQADGARCVCPDVQAQCTRTSYRLGSQVVN